MDRRQFVKVTAATGAGATLAGCGNPENQFIRFIPEEQLTPGVAVWKPSICPLCPAGCGLTVRVMPGDAEVIYEGQVAVIQKGLAKKLEGNPEHPVNQGRLCVRGQAAIQVTYHPDRLTQPLRRTGARGSGEFEPITWDEALEELGTQLNGLADAGRQSALGFWTRPLTGQRQRLVGEFLSRFGAPTALTFEVFGDAVLREANRRSFGYPQLPTLDLAQSRYVLSLGSDFLGTWNSPVSQNLGFGEMRQGRLGVRGRFVQVEPRMSQTGANADEWLPARPGTEGVLALGIANVILNGGLRSAEDAGRAGQLIEGWAAGLPAYSPEEVENSTGIAPERLERLAREFAETAPAVAVVSGAPLAHTNGLSTALAVNALNALVGSVGQPGGLLFTPRQSDPSPEGPAQPLDRAAAEDLAAGTSEIDLLLINDTNPVFGAPPDWQIPDTLAEVGFIASFGHFLDETSIQSDLILPDHTFLESWVDNEPESGSSSGVLGVAPPAMLPLHTTRAMPDVLLEIGRSLANPLEPALPWQTYEEMLQARFDSLPPSDGAEDVWNTALEQGGWWTDPPAEFALEQQAPDSNPVEVGEAEFDGATETYPFHFLPYASQAFLDGSLAHLPWLQELPDVVSTAMWSSWVEINPATAAGLGIALGDLVEIASAHGTIRAPALLFPGIAPDVVAMPVGQGHETFTRYASNRGSNPIRILAPLAEPETGALAWAATRVNISRVDGEGDLILFAGALREHEEHSR